MKNLKPQIDKKNPICSIIGICICWLIPLASIILGIIGIVRKENKEKIKTRYEPKTEGRWKKKMGNYFNLWIPTDKNKFVDYQVSKTGYSFSIDSQHNQVFINGYYHYFNDKEFKKFLRDLKRFTDAELKTQGVQK